MSTTRPEPGRIAALRVPSFRRYAAMQLMSGIAVSSQRVTELWVVLEITGTGASVGTAAALRTAPSLVLAGVGGFLADRFDRRLLLVLTQGGRGALAAALALLSTGGNPAVTTIYLMVFGLGCVGAIDAPIRRALVRDVVEPATLASAASLHTATISTARLIGPLCAGVLIATSGADWAFAFGAGASVVAIVLVRMIRLVPAGQDARAATTRAGDGVRGALARIWSPALRRTFLLLAVFSMIGWNLDVLFPLLADIDLGGGPLTYSVLVMVMAVGSLAGSLWAAAGVRSADPEARLLPALLAYAVTLLALAAVDPVVLVAATVLISGLAGGVFLSVASASVQTGADGAVQGRQAALYTFIFVGGRAIGAPVIGRVADAVGARSAVVLLAVAMSIGGVVIHLSVPRPR